MPQSCSTVPLTSLSSISRARSGGQAAPEITAKRTDERLQPSYDPASRQAALCAGPVNRAVARPASMAAAKSVGVKRGSSSTAAPAFSARCIAQMP